MGQDPKFCVHFTIHRVRINKTENEAQPILEDSRSNDTAKPKEEYPAQVASWNPLKEPLYPILLCKYTLARIFYFDVIDSINTLPFSVNVAEWYLKPISL